MRNLYFSTLVYFCDKLKYSRFDTAQLYDLAGEVEITANHPLKRILEELSKKLPNPIL
jgi:hypothetical protein